MESLSPVQWRTRDGWFTFMAIDRTRAMPIDTILDLQHSKRSRERRRSLRVTPDPFLTIRLPSGNTGIVLDVSHEGMGFLASAPVEETNSIRFEISSRSTRGSEAAGQLMWKDSTGKRVGLKFTLLPEELRTVILSCLPAREVSPASGSELETANAKILDLGEQARPVSQRDPKKLAFIANVITVTLACFIALAIWFSVDRRGATDLVWHWERGISKFLSSHQATHAGTESPKTLGSSAIVPAKQVKLIANSSSANIPVQVASNEKIETAVSPKSSNVAPLATIEAGDKGTTTGAKQASPLASADQGQTQLALARELLRKDADSDDQSAAAQLLWQAVEKGNVAAELELADLYLSGQGVPKSCSQARVLLTAAQNRKSELAGQKLDDFSKYGCE